MNKTEFRIDEVKFGNGEKHCYIFKKTFNFFGFPYWKLYNTNMNNGQFLSIDEAEAWLNTHVEEKELSKIEPYVINRKFITI
jgi:hypothetical protein